MNSLLCDVISYNTEFLTSIVFIALNFFAPVIFILGISLHLSLVAFAFLPISTIIYILFKKKQKLISCNKQAINETYYSFQSNIFKSVQAIKGLKIQKKVEHNFKIHTQKSYNIEQKDTNLKIFIKLCNEVANNIFGVIIILVSSILIIRGKLTVGLMVSFNIYIDKLFSSIASIQKIRLNEESIAVALEKLSTIMDSPQEVNTIKDLIVPASRISLDINNISFAYQGKRILDDVTFSISGNGLYSIVGKNGCGKTTLLKLLLKYYNPNNGDIYINGIPYSNLSDSDIRNIVTYITKEPFILQDSIKNNICVLSELSDEATKDICKKVCLLQFIDDLPHGLNTCISNEGALLSSGMKQKLAFARAIAIGSPIIILDETTSDLDGDSENQIMNIIRNLSQDHIIISVTHKKAAAVDSKDIFVLNNGKLVSSGNFDILSDSCDLFKQLFIDGD